MSVNWGRRFPENVQKQTTFCRQSTRDSVSFQNWYFRTAFASYSVAFVSSCVQVKFKKWTCLWWYLYAIPENNNKDYLLFSVVAKMSQQFAPTFFGSCTISVYSTSYAKHLQLKNMDGDMLWPGRPTDCSSQLKRCGHKVKLGIVQDRVQCTSICLPDWTHTLVKDDGDDNDISNGAFVLTSITKSLANSTMFHSHVRMQSVTPKEHVPF